MRFSIICLTYKRHCLLEEAVFSVLQQTFKDWEMLIINDYSSQKICFNHPKVRVFNLDEKFKTLGDKRNFGVEQSKGELVIQLDDDDLYLPEYLENLNNFAKDADVLSPQRPIYYFNNFSKIHLSPYPICNTLVYRRDKVGSVFHYESVNFDELTPFYLKIRKYSKFSQIIGLLKPDQCGYVYRQDIDFDKKYAMAVFNKKTIEEQNKILESLEDKTGTIVLNPHWNKNYIQIIKDNCKFPAPRGSSEMEDLMKKYESDLKSAKITWEKAMKFAESANSRGLLATAMDYFGINSEFGARVSDEIYQQRKLSCFGDPSKFIKPCSRLNKTQKGSFCSSCGCGTNKLAQMDGDGYTKLHYPMLECPMRRSGFSNEEKTRNYSVPLSIIIPVLNDNEELNLTIKSIRETSPPNVEIIVIDDASDVPVVVDDKTVKLVRLENRQGVGSTRHMGATMATTNYLLFVDSHMRFDPKWYNHAISKLILNPPNVVWCATCFGLEEGCMDLRFHKGCYCGAKLVLYDEKENQVFEGKWVEEKPENEYEVSCLMGACYFFHKSWFMYIGGTKSLKMWGSDEPLLSTKTLLAGGKIMLTKDIKIGHKFRSTSPYATGVDYIIYNKLRSMYMLFSDDLYKKLSNKIPEDGNKQAALKMLEQDKEEINKERYYYKTIFNKDEKWLCEYLNFKI